jgi:predicted nucleic acid-binding Zn ribbon protein
LRQTKPKLIKNSIQAILNDYGLLPRMKQFEALNLWAEIVGEQIAKVAKAEKIDHGSLIVRVEKPVWRNELIFLKKEIIAKINEMMKEEIVKEIIFK